MATNTVDETIKEIVSTMSPSVGAKVIESYLEMPREVKEAVDGLHRAIDELTDIEGIKKVEEALEVVREACDANIGYEEVYKAAVREAKEEVADIVVNGGMKLFDIDEDDEEEEQDEEDEEGKSEGVEAE